MSTSLRLLRIEFWRSPAVWIVPFAVIAAGVWAWNELLLEVPLWTETSALLQNVLLLTAPALGGIAAWQGGRDRRRRMDDLLNTTPWPRTLQRVTTSGGALGWGWLGAGGVVLVLFVLTAIRGAWGTPYLWPLAVGLAALFANTAAGFTAGRLLPSRFTPPIVAAALLGLPTLPLMDEPNLVGDIATLGRFLSPLNHSPFRDVYFGLVPDMGEPLVLLLVGAGGVALGVLALRTRPSALGGAVVVGSLALAAFSATIGFHRGSNDVPYVFDRESTAGFRWLRDPAPYEPACSSGSFIVCVHPAYGSLLPGLAEGYSTLAASLAGVPGAPVRAEQVPYFYELDTDRRPQVLTFGLHPRATSNVQHPFYWHDAAEQFVRVREGAVTGEVHDVIAAWLVLEAGMPLGHIYCPGCGTAYSFNDETRAAASRFAALDPTVRRAWLEANFAALRAGELTLEDLP